MSAMPLAIGSFNRFDQKSARTFSPPPRVSISKNNVSSDMLTYPSRAFGTGIVRRFLMTLQCDSGRKIIGHAVAMAENMVDVPCCQPHPYAKRVSSRGNKKEDRKSLHGRT